MSNVYDLTKAMHSKEMQRGNKPLDRAIEQRFLGNEITRTRNVVEKLECLEQLEFEVHEYLNRLSNDPDTQYEATRWLYVMMSTLLEIRRQAESDLPALVAHSDIFSGMMDVERAA